MARLTISLLGPPAIEVGARPIQVDTRKAIALLAYLAVHRQPQQRDSLAALLWPEYDDASARASLRRTLSALKGALPQGCLEIGRDRLGLNRAADLWLDLDEFRGRLAEVERHAHPRAEACPACIPLLSGAVELYRGQFLAGFAIRESASFDDWQVFQAESLAREQATALEQLVNGLSAEHEFQRAVEYARRWLAMDPLHEPAHRQLMLLYAWSGDRASALRQYRECVRTLDQELGVAPLGETTQLAEAIKENRAPAPPSRHTPQPAGEARIERRPEAAPLTARPSAHSAHHPLVGRSAEWKVLQHAHEQAEEGYLVVVEGEPGIGKTRLAEEFLGYARAEGAAAIAGHCFEGEARLAYLPFVEALRLALAAPSRDAWLAQVSDHWLAEAARLLPELGALRPSLPPPLPLDSPGAPTRFLEALCQLVVAAASAGTRPGVVFLDDLHWADEASLDLLGYLARHRPRRLLVLLSWRSEEVPPGHRLRALLASAERGGRATSISLARFGLDEVRLLLAASSEGVELPPALSEALLRETGGLPFFLVEYLDAMASSGLQPGGALPRGVRELLRSRTARLSETGLQLLTTAAVIGWSFDFETLHQASGRSEDETVAGLEELMRAGLVREIESAPSQASFDFSHERLRDLVYAEASLVRRRLLHRRVAEAIQARMRGRADAPEVGKIAHHYQQAGQEVEAAHHFKQAGEQARRVYANAEALAHFRAALALGHPNVVGLHEAIGDLHTLAGEYGEARASYERAASSSPQGRLARIEHKLGELYRRQGEWELAESHFQAALAALDDQGAAGERASVYADWCLVAHRKGEAQRANELGQQALDLASQADDPQALAQAHNILGILAGSRGDVALARSHLEQSLRMAESLPDQSARVAALNNLALLNRKVGKLGDGIELLETALSLCAAQGDRHRQAALHNNLADLLHAAAQREQAMEQLKQAVSLFAEVGAEPGTMQPEIWKLTEW